MNKNKFTNEFFESLLCLEMNIMNQFNFQKLTTLLGIYSVSI